ncbi:MAG: pyridoxamine 5'-phosphate oxidase family protein, partial [Oscillospiraceae bacterium]|nr:pyridoxamine 5'-phosphate oxidase family protein [Oscillospiraceae bacterium]
MTQKELEKFIDRQNVSFICSVDENNYPNMKAMLKPRKRVGLKEFYFSTNTSSMRVKQFLNNPNSSIYFYHKG